MESVNQSNMESENISIDLKNILSLNKDEIVNNSLIKSKSTKDKSAKEGNKEKEKAKKPEYKPSKNMLDLMEMVDNERDNIKNKSWSKINKSAKLQLLDDYITREELWACTTCNACVEACPVGINPLSIIMDMRQYLVMEQSAAPTDLNNAMTNIENNAAPWPFNQMDRANWINEN